MRLSLVGRVECEVDGRVYAGTYRVVKGLLKVTMRGHGEKSAVPGPRPEITAKSVLRELVEEARLKGNIRAVPSPAARS